jgi:hypothetical protein
MRQSRYGLMDQEAALPDRHSSQIIDQKNQPLPALRLIDRQPNVKLRTLS